MRNTLLILDCYFLGHRAFHSKGWMEFGSVKTGVIYGILQDVISLQDAFDTSRLVFVFDHGKGKRKDLLPEYKEQRRKDMTEEQEALYKDFKQQMAQLRKSYLPRIGYKNVLWETGYEADDIIATCCHSLQEGEDAVIVSADTDLFQLLGPNVLMHNPNTFKTTSLQSFTRDYGITPAQWAKVKAIAGCSSDNVPGIRGVGNKTAIKYVKGELKAESAAYKAIKEGWRDVVLRNRPLVQLPFEGCPTFEIATDALSKEGWAEVASELGLSVLKDRLPLTGRGSRRPRLI
jgi:5'-3' exonuclease